MKGNKEVHFSIIQFTKRNEMHSTELKCKCTSLGPDFPITTGVERCNSEIAALQPHKKSLDVCLINYIPSQFSYKIENPP